MNKAFANSIKKLILVIKLRVINRCGGSASVGWKAKTFSIFHELINNPKEYLISISG